MPIRTDEITNFNNISTTNFLDFASALLKSIKATEEAIENKYLAKLSDGAPYYEKETFFSISAQFSSGKKQDSIVDALSKRFPNYI
jgi:hypothetical protein